MTPQTGHQEAEAADTDWPLLTINNIEVIYDHVILVLRGVSLEVPEGGIVALLGANGAGKTTTLKAISNLLGAERGDVVARMGEPSGEYTLDDGGEPQLWWAQDQYDFRAYLDARGRVLDLVGDYDALGAADRDQLDCPELR